MQSNLLEATAAPLTQVLHQVALDVAEAQAALDRHAETRIAQVDEIESPLNAIAFYFPDVELDLQLAFSMTRFEGKQTLAVAPANPTANGFFRLGSFSSHLRARIAPRAAIVPVVSQEENSDA